MLGCTQQPVVPFTAKYCVLFGCYGVCLATELLILQNDWKLVWQKQRQVGSHMACTPFENLNE